LLLADLYTRTKEGRRAEEQYREACRLHPESPDAALQFSSFYMGQGSFDEAELMLTDIVRRFPKLTRARMQYAVVLSAKHKYKEASANIHMIPPPHEPTARVRYFRLEASIRSGLGDAPGAASAIEQALKVMPTDPQLARMAALTESQAGEWKACIDHIFPLFVKRPDPETGLLLLRAQLASDVDFSDQPPGLRRQLNPASALHRQIAWLDPRQSQCR
jgi:thioredoxin-like negative regulator of GroEL